MFLIVFLFCCSYAFIKIDPIKKTKTFQTTVVDNVQYAIVYVDGDKYYLEEAKIDTEIVNDDVLKKSLTIYTDKQRIILCDDIVIEVGVYEKIIKE